MRSSSSKKVLKSFKELKAVLQSGDHPPPKAAKRRKPALMEQPLQNEQHLFRSAMADVTPLPRRDRIKKSVNLSFPKPAPGDPDAEVLESLKNLVCRGEGFVISDTPEYMEGTGHRIPGLVARRLHQGNFAVQSCIDLHGLSVAGASEAFEAFMTAAVAGGKRSVLVIHGRGLSSPAKPVLKSRVYEWLTRGRWRNWVIAFTSARSCDGGSGATYVLLRERPLPKRSRSERPGPKGADLS